MKGLLRILMVSLITCAGGQFAFAQTVPGDLDGDGRARLADVEMALDTTNGVLDTSPDINADANGDDRIGISDAVMDLRFIAYPKEEVFTNSRGMTFNLILKGTFTMGSPVDEPERQEEEVQHEVTLSKNFFMQTREITQGQWAAVMGQNPSLFPGDDTRPVENVSWEAVQEFLSILNQDEDRLKYRLPTEAQWEYAARAGTDTAFCSGDMTAEPLQCDLLDQNLDQVGYYCGNSASTTHPTGDKTPNAWGLYDMHGNVFEWCQDWHGPYSEVPVTDPKGPSTGSKKVLRGGDFNSFPAFNRSAYRWLGSPASSSAAHCGFRLVLYTVHPDQYAVKNVGIEKDDEQATLWWDPKDNALSYNIYVHTKPGVNKGFYSKKIASAASPHVVADLVNGIDYYFTVTAVTPEGETPESAEVSTKPARPLTITNGVGMVFNLINPGTFTMGSPEGELGHSEDETQHDVILTTQFYMQTTEVTQDQWEAVMDGMLPNPSQFVGCGGDCPVEMVSWSDAQAFVTRLNTLDDRTYRLPTEAEWEYCARATSTAAFANGDIAQELCDPLDANLDLMGWYCGNALDNMTHPVEQKDANLWGLYDMHGNVYEWCSDRYGAYPAGPVTDPQGPTVGNLRVLRGGSYAHDAWECRSATRYYAAPTFDFPTVGFRVVMELRD